MRRFTMHAIGLSLLAPMATADAAPARHVPATEGFPFSKAVAVDGVLYLSGEIGTGPDGKLVQGFDAQVRQTMDNIVPRSRAKVSPRTMCSNAPSILPT